MWHPKWNLLGGKLDIHPSREITSIYALPKIILEQCMSSLQSLQYCSWPTSLTVSPNRPKLFRLKLLAKWASRWIVWFCFFNLVKGHRLPPPNHCSVWAHIHIQPEGIRNYLKKKKMCVWVGGLVLVFISKCRTGFPENWCFHSPVLI